MVAGRSIRQSRTHTPHPENCSLPRPSTALQPRRQSLHEGCSLKAWQQRLRVYDPPYIERAGVLYLDSYAIEDHKRLAKTIARLKIPWIVTYDIAAIEHGLFADIRHVVYGLHYTVQARYKGQEVMYFSNKLACRRSPSC